MLIDSTHKRWFLVTLIVAGLAVAAYALLVWRAPGGLTGGSAVGLWYGVAGAGLMIYAGLLSALRHVPSWWWLGARQTWLRGHIWLGLLSAVFLLCHAGFHWGGPLERLLWATVIGVLVTGVVGLLLQHVLPRSMTHRVPCEAPYEQIPHVCQRMRREADKLVDAVCQPLESAADAIESTRGAIRLAEDGPAQLRTFYETDLRPFLAERAPRASPLLNPLQAEARFDRLRRLADLKDAEESLGRLAALCEERRQLTEQERLHFWLHAWLFLHVPLSVAVLVLGVAHVVTALYY